MKKVLIGAVIVVVLLILSGYLNFGASGPTSETDVAEGRRFAEKVLLGPIATWDYEAFCRKIVTDRVNKKALPKVQSAFESAAQQFGPLVAYSETAGEFKTQYVLPECRQQITGSITYVADFRNGSMLITLGVYKWKGAWGVGDINLAPPE